MLKSYWSKWHETSLPLLHPDFHQRLFAAVDYLSDPESGPQNLVPSESFDYLEHGCRFGIELHCHLGFGAFHQGIDAAGNNSIRDGVRRMSIGITYNVGRCHEKS